MGGSAVEISLAAVGFVPQRLGLALVESARPSSEPFDTVVAQNAWNVIPRAQFNELAREYLPKARLRMEARRALSQFNLTRAGRVVCLTNAMADVCARTLDRSVEVQPVTVPAAFLREVGQPAKASACERFALIPGTVTWYKNSLAGLDVARQLGLTKVVYAGATDERYRASILKEADSVGLSVDFGVYSAQEMRRLYATAEVTIIPSRLESLSFPVAEAILCGSRVMASALPVHVEVAARLGGSFRELPGIDFLGEIIRDGAPFSRDLLRREWHDLGQFLRLPGQVSGQLP